MKKLWGDFFARVSPLLVEKVFSQMGLEKQRKMCYTVSNPKLFSF